MMSDDHDRPHAGDEDERQSPKEGSRYGVLGMNVSSETSKFDESDQNGMQFNEVPYDQLCSEDLKGQEFKTSEEGERFFNDYAKSIGFDVRKDYRRFSVRAKDRVTSLKLVCSAQGKRREPDMDKKRKRNPRKETRFDCPCLFKLRYSPKSDVYIVDAFIPDHSHPLAQEHESHLLRTRRSVEEPHVALLISMRRVSVKPCHTYEYIVDVSGGFKNVGFLKKDMYNKLESMRKEIILEGDAQAALTYMKAKITTDSQFYCKFSVDEENRLANMVWRDTNSLVDYTCFGDVLVFDSTYKTNSYGKPLVLFVGSNNHLSTTVFGFALLMDETIETYTWLLETFISSMNNKRPIAVLTDGDLAMQKAIEVVLPECPHRLCTWHVAKNARKHLRNNQALSEFKRCMWEEVTIDGFEARWHAMVDAHNFQNKDWITSMYKIKHLWAEAFINGHFFARMRSTQRCEGMNSYMKGYLKGGVKLCDLIPALDRALLRLRSQVVEEDYRSNNLTHRLTSTLRTLEQHAGSIYTDGVFVHVRKEIDGVGALIHKVIPIGSMVVYLWTSYNQTDGKSDRQIDHSTHYFPDENNPRLKCSCKMFEREGIPCCHIFNVLKNERMNELPSSLILKRWTKSAKSGMHTIVHEDNIPDKAIEFARYGDLNSKTSKLCFIASRTKTGTEMLDKEVMRLEPILTSLWKHEKETSTIPENCNNILRDPVRVISKGSRNPTNQGMKSKRRCGSCKGFGHTAATCDKKKR